MGRYLPGAWGSASTMGRAALREDASCFCVWFLLFVSALLVVWFGARLRVCGARPTHPRLSFLCFRSPRSYRHSPGPCILPHPHPHIHPGSLFTVPLRTYRLAPAFPSFVCCPIAHTTHTHTYSVLYPAPVPFCATACVLFPIAIPYIHTCTRGGTLRRHAYIELTYYIAYARIIWTMRQCDWREVKPDSVLVR